MDLAARASLRHFGRHPWQLGLAALGIALGVSLAVGIDVGTASVSRAFALSSQAVTGKATHEILGGPSGVPEILYRDLRLLPDLPAGLALAPIVEGTAAPEAGGGVLRILGIDPIAEGPFRGTPGADLSPRSDTLAALLTRPGTAVLSAETAAALGVGKGGRLAIRAGGRRASLEVVDVAHAATPDQRRALEWVALVDIATAQELLGITARLSRIDVIVSPVSPADGEPAALGWLAAHIPGTAYVTPVAVRAGALAQLTRAFDLNLRALSLLGLLVGAFLVYNTMSFSVVQRRRSLAILRTLGATRAQLGRNLLVEALALGIGGSALGVLLGLGLSRGLVRLIARAVSDLYFAVSVIDAPTPVAPLARGFVLGVLAALGSAWPAARDATATEPGIALHRSHAEARARTRTTRLAGASVALGAAAAGALALSGRSLTLGLGALVVLMVGCAGLVPAFVLGASRAGAVVLGAARGVTGRLASRSLGAGISRTGVAAAALTLALSVTTGLGVMVASFRGAVERWLGDTLRADVYVSAPSAVGARADSPLPPSLLGRVGAIAGVAQVATNRIVSVRANGTPTSLMAIGLPAGRAPAGEILQGSAPAALAGFANGDGILVSEPLAWKRGIRVGDKVALATDRGTHAFAVLAVYRDYGSDAGAITISRGAYDRFFDDPRVTAIALDAAPGVSADELVARVRARLGPDDAVLVRSNRALREASLRIFDRTFEVTGVLRLIALIVAGFGVTSALMALGLERVRELATLRALGATPAQVVEVTIVETGLLGLLAGMLAIPIGMVLAVVLVFVINQRSFGWTMRLSVSLGALWTAPALGLGAGIIAGIYPAWRAARVVPAQALRDE